MKIEGLSEKSSGIMLGYIDKVNGALESYMENISKRIGMQKSAADAMRYSLSAGGKRIRPVLVMEFCRMCGGDNDDAVSAACAIEMIHTFSLIHDDLPCMDNDDFRRGKPSCHKAYGETAALLAGDALENEAFRIISHDGKLSDSAKIRLIRILSDAVGLYGMIGGQVIDTENDGKALPEGQLLEMYGMKTGALLKAACAMGCVCAGADEDKINASQVYAGNLGLAFQIIDDILDIIGDEEELGKKTGSDRINGKNTYAVMKGLERSEEYASELTENALSALDAFGDSVFLRELTGYLLIRKK